jgi:hypothetical protein
MLAIADANTVVVKNAVAAETKTAKIMRLYILVKKLLTAEISWT